MKRIRKVCLSLILMIVFPFSCFSESTGTENSTDYDWTPVIEAIIGVESEGNSKAVSGNSCGAMQITPVLVKECNSILRRKGSKKRFSLRDRFSINKSKEMFLLIQSFYNPLHSVEMAIRAWNGGIHYSVKRTQRYYDRVMNRMK